MMPQRTFLMMLIVICVTILCCVPGMFSSSGMKVPCPA